MSFIKAGGGRRTSSTSTTTNEEKTHFTASGSYQLGRRRRRLRLRTGAVVPVLS